MNEVDEISLIHRLLFIALMIAGFVYMCSGIYGAVRFYERHVLEHADCVRRVK